MNTPRCLVVFLALAASACGGDKASDAEAAAKEHFMSAQQKMLEQAEAVKELANEKLEEQKKAMEEAAGK